MNIFTKYILMIILGFITHSLSSQDDPEIDRSFQYLSLKAQYIQLDDQVNYGYVFDGINLAVGYGFQKENQRVVIRYEGEIGFGSVNNLGHGFYWKFKPIDFFHGFKINNSTSVLGGYMGAEYSWQQYDELQGGRLFWMSNIEIGPEIQFSIPLGSRNINVGVSSSLAGLAARPEFGPEQYYYSFSFSEFISSSHRNAKFGSFGLFNHTKLNVELLGNGGGRIMLGYEFDYLGYYEEPKATFLSHSINLKWKL